jgi:hypothetical protein
MRFSEPTRTHPSTSFDITTGAMDEDFFLMKQTARCGRLLDGPMRLSQRAKTQHERRISRRHLMAVAVVAISFAPLCAIARAQDSSVPMPDTGGYGLNDAPPSQDPGGFGYASPDDVTMPSTDIGAPPDSVSIPIPGGGQVSVDGPDAPDNNGISTNPGSNWAVQQQAPASQGVGPIGP